MKKRAVSGVKMKRLLVKMLVDKGDDLDLKPS